MQYSLLIYQSPEDFGARADPARREAYWGPWAAYGKALKEAGVFAGGLGLQPPGTAKTLAADGSAARVQDGPFADTKEQLGGVFIIDVPDAATALDWARRCPRAPGRKVEVRPNLPPLG